MKINMKGFRELERALAEELPKATAMAVLRRTAKLGLAPVEAEAKRLVPRDKGDLADSIATKAVRAQRLAGGRYARSQGVTMATGPTGRRASDPGANAAWQEFGHLARDGSFVAAQPYMRPAADAEGERALQIVRDELAGEIDKAKARIARRAARKG